MICKNCQTYYVRDPCPNCGRDSAKTNDEASKEIEESIKPSQIRKRETDSGSQVLMQKEDEDQLVKPSQRLKQEQQGDDDLPSFKRFEQEQDDNETLVKPSERLRKSREDDDEIPSFQRFDRDNTQTKVSRVEVPTKKEDDEIPSFQRYQPDKDVDVSNISKLNKPEQQEKLKNDKEYRNQVKETLEEVMGLLEKLIEDD